MGITNRGWVLRILIPIIIVLLSTICFQFGVNVGNLTNENSHGVLMHILYSISLFTLGGVSLGVPVSGPEWAKILLYFMYFIAPAISIGALMEHLFTSFRFYHQILLFRGNHSVIIGAGRVASNLPQKINSIFKNEYKRTKMGFKLPIIIADKNTNALLYPAEKYLIESIDAEDPLIIDKLNIQKARFVFILTDKDWINLNLFFKLNKLIKNPKTNVFVRLKSEDLIIELSKKFTNPNFHFFNVHIESIRLLFKNKILDNSILNEWVASVKKSEPKVLVFLGFGRFGQNVLAEYLNEFKNDIKKIIVISPNAKNEWERYHLLDANNESNILPNIKIEIYDSNNEDISLIKTIINDSKDYNSVLWTLGSGTDEVNLNASTIINRFYEKQTMGFQDVFMLIRTKTMNNSYEELINDKNKRIVLMPTYDIIGNYFLDELNKVKEA